MPKVRLNGIDLYYDEQGQGRSIVFAHGMGGNHASWWQQRPFFSQQYQVVTFDHRGFGLSQEEAGGLGQAAFVDDLRGLLDHLNIEKTALVAQSMGGWTALGFAVRYPERVWALVLADTPGGIDDAELRQKWEPVVQGNVGKTTHEVVFSPSFPKKDPTKADLYLQISSFNNPPPPPVSSLVHTDGPKPGALTKLKVPVLFIVGQEDAATPPEIIRLAHKLIPGSSLVEVPEAGHSVYFERPDVFNKLVHEFLLAAIKKEG